MISEKKPWKDKKYSLQFSLNEYTKFVKEFQNAKFKKVKLSVVDEFLSDLIYTAFILPKALCISDYGK